MPAPRSSAPHAESAENMPGLQPPRLNSGEPVTGRDKHRHRIENKQRRVRFQESQEPTSYWAWQKGSVSLPTPKQGPRQYRGAMCPSGLALHHPAADTLLKYATRGCEVRTGKPWTRDEMQAAVEKGPHVSALLPEAMEQFAAEVAEKERQGQCRVVLWDDIKANPPEQLKISPLAAVPHKSRTWRAILDLSFRIRLDQRTVPSVNESTEKTAPKGACDQLGHALARIIHAFAESGDDAKVFMAKWDIKDGFWRLDCEEGKEWNFCYVLPQPAGQPIKLVVPTSLQMGWVESPPYFCAASETGRDVACQYIDTPVGSLPEHKFMPYTNQGRDYGELPAGGTGDNGFRFLVEVYVDDYIAIATPTTRAQLDHVANGVLMGIHDVFPPNDEDDNDPVSLKKLLKEEGSWALQKDVLGFMFDGNEKTL